jgi:ferredoxin-type protein NapF
MISQFQTSRRGLFRSLVQKSQGNALNLKALRPPGAVEEVDFVDTCSRCNACIAACDVNIIVSGDGGFPELSFTRDGCTGCLACIEVCEPKALTRSDTLWPLGLLEIDHKCLAKNKITCQSCKDACDHAAIQFPMTTATPVPNLNPDQCTGCGECVSVCPVNSISIKPVTTLERVNDQ